MLAKGLAVRHQRWAVFPMLLPRSRDWWHGNGRARRRIPAYIKLEHMDISEAAHRTDAAYVLSAPMPRADAEEKLPPARDVECSEAEARSRPRRKRQYSPTERLASNRARSRGAAIR
jgi:hypothetical protein